LIGGAAHIASKPEFEEASNVLHPLPGQAWNMSSLVAEYFDARTDSDFSPSGTRRHMSTTDAAILDDDGIGYQQCSPGLFVSRYRSAEEMAPQLQTKLLEDVASASRDGPIGLVFDVSCNVYRVPLAVPTLWIEVAMRPELRLRAMVIVTDSLGVRMAARGFALSNKIRRTLLDVEVTHDLEFGKGWARRAMSRIQ